VKFLRRCLHIAYDAFLRFNADDGWAIASHLALSALMALFPFLLVLTALAGILGAGNLADESARIILETWPEEVAAALMLEVQGVLASAHSGTLTVGIVLAVYFASSGVEGLRVALNRAYAVVDQRSWWLLRLESIAYVLVGAVALLALSFLILLAPLIWRTAVRIAPRIDQFSEIVTFVRFGVAIVLLVVSLVIAHLWLPAGRRRLREIAPGILVTLVMWLAGGIMFGAYLAEFAFTYARYYAGLASVMIVLVFLYLTAAIFIYGGELNAAAADAEPAPGAKPPPEED
jgi:membrane protein